jgi:hypothetical protein
LFTQGMASLSLFFCSSCARDRFQIEDAVDGMGLAAKQSHATQQLGARLKEYRTELEDLKKQFSKAQYAV